MGDVCGLVKLIKNDMETFCIFVNEDLNDKNWEKVLLDALYYYFNHYEWYYDNAPLEIFYEYFNSDKNWKMQIPYFELHTLKDRINKIKEKKDELHS